MSKAETPLEQFKRATSSTVRAMAKNSELSVVFSTNGRGISGDELRLPTPAKNLPKEDVQRIRGRADATALNLRYHDAKAHQKHKPSDSQAAAIFDAVEQARCEALGINRMEGVAQNLAFLQEDTFTQQGYGNAVTSEDIPLHDAMSVFARQALTNRTATGVAGKIAEIWRPNLPPEIFQTLDKLGQHLSDQAGFARTLQDLLGQLDFSLEEDEESESDREDDQDQQDENSDDQDSKQQTSEKSAPMEAESGEQGDSEGSPDDSGENEGQQMEGQGQETAGSPDRSAEFNPDHNYSQISGYKTFTTRFDETIEAQDLCDDEELTRLRELLDKQLSHLQGVISKLANRLQRRLMAQQTRNWEFNLEEGLLDTARLTRVVTNPLHSLSFKQESDTEFKDTAVTLLIDNSGSMRGRPITIAAMSADILARTLERCGVKVEILGFTTKMWKGGQSREQWIEQGKPANPGRLNDLRHIIYKKADAPMRRARKNLGLMLREGILKENIDGEALLWAHSRLQARTEHRRILMVISDGAPVDDSTLSVNSGSYLEDHLREAIDLIEKRSPVELLAIGIGHDVTRYYKRAVTISDAEQLGGIMMEKLAELFAENPRDKNPSPDSGTRRKRQ
ncbi:cobaltochelatase subunit CobT [Kiloniella laminariae]|uniref:Cobaltochelatase subunit CobT n=1 Tax=Kiloniella laminariae TaxID=454162 RepID=A0ABT4LM53_9PROT|nr:cobaltochelatase subunit CobT [Kiloniella laminariae]MCZ4282189.1 cobaltochelatase subunit CobT [Kiloniella laminariae]